MHLLSKPRRADTRSAFRFHPRSFSTFSCDISEKVRDRARKWSEWTTLGSVSRHCCMSVEYYSDNYYGGYGELANPLQWPQLRKKRRLVVFTTTPPSLYHLKLLLLCFESPRTIGPSRRPTHQRIRAARGRPWQPWSIPLRPSLTPPRQTLLPPKV